MGEHPFYRNIKPMLLRGIEILSKDLIRNISTKYFLTEHGVKEFEEKLIPKLERLSEIDRNTIYFDGLKKVEEEIKRIQSEFRPGRIVVFIDDLDRCSPETAVEIFESIKMFLDIEGFIFILGLSRDLLDKMIEIKLEKAGLKGIDADEYIRKIIQIEIHIQKWNNASIEELIKTLSLKLEDKDRSAINNNLDLILKVVDENPRLVKRYINNYIIASSAREKDIKPRIYFLGEVLNKKWPNFYEDLGSDEHFRKDVKNYIKKPITQILKEIENEKKKYKENIPDNFKKILSIDETLWYFITEQKIITSFLEICDQWSTYESAVESVKTISPTKKFDISIGRIFPEVFKLNCNSFIFSISGTNILTISLPNYNTVIDLNKIHDDTLEKSIKDTILQAGECLKMLDSLQYSLCQSRQVELNLIRKNNIIPWRTEESINKENLRNETIIIMTNISKIFSDILKNDNKKQYLEPLTNWIKRASELVQI